MTDLNHNATKMIIAAAIYLMVAIMVAAGLSLRGHQAVAEKSDAPPAGYKQSALAEKPSDHAGQTSANKGWSADETSFSTVDATMLLAPAVQKIVSSQRRFIF